MKKKFVMRKKKKKVFDEANKEEIVGAHENKEFVTQKEISCVVEK